jgi:hypothetical protein
MNLGGDTYALSFRAMHTDSAKKMKLLPKDWQRAFQSSVFVFLLQLSLILMVNFYLFGTLTIIPAPNL